MGGNHPAPLHAQIVATGAAYLQMGGIATVLFGQQLVNQLGYAEPPEWLALVQNNQLQVFIGLFMLSSIGQNMASTGTSDRGLGLKRWELYDDLTLF